MMSFTKQLPKEMLFFFSRFKIGDTVEVSYRSDQDYQGSYKQIKIIGEIDGITKVEKVGNSSSGFSSWAQNSSAPFSQSYSSQSFSQNYSQLTGDDFFNALHKDSGECLTSSNGSYRSGYMPANSKVDCIFHIANPDLVFNFIKFGGKVKAQISSASKSGQSEDCFVNNKDYTPAILQCPQTPTGNKETNDMSSNPSDLTLWISNYSGDYNGLVNGKVKIDYGVMKGMGDLGINGKLEFSKATGKTMISLQTDVKNYGEKEEIVVRVSVPTGMEMTSKNCGAPRIGSGGGYYDKTFTCSFNTPNH